MRTTTDYLEQPAGKVQSNVAVKQEVGRMAYLDTLKVILICLVIGLHTAIVYGASGDWNYVDPVKDEASGIVLTLFTGMVQAFSLGLYFFVAGYFTPGSYDRKGILVFWKDRLIRLALPMIVYSWVLSRVPNYFASVAYGSETRSFGDYFAQTFLKTADGGPTWFIFALLLFTAGYTLWRLATRFSPPSWWRWITQLKTPGKKEIIGFGLLVSILMFIIGIKSPVNNTWNAFGIYSLMIVFFAQYIPFFIAGVIAYRNDWLNRWNGKDLRLWSRVSFGLIFALPVLFVIGMLTGGSPEAFLGGLTWQSAAFMGWVGLFSVSISMTLILWLRDHKTPLGRMLAFAGPNSFAVYLIHPLILVPVTVLMTSVALYPLLKFVIVLPVVLVLCFLAADAIRHLPGMKAVL